jgi:hypothetical protein
MRWPWPTGLAVAPKTNKQTNKPIQTGNLADLIEGVIWGFMLIKHSDTKKKVETDAVSIFF